MNKTYCHPSADLWAVEFLWVIKFGNPLKRLRHNLHSKIVSTSFNKICLSCLVPEKKESTKVTLTCTFKLGNHC